MAKKFYVVWQGFNPGIYESWDECKAQIQGFPNAIYKSFPSLQMATDAYRQAAASYIGKSVPKKEFSPEELARIGKPIQNSWSVDAACSGNPGVLEYQGVYTATGEQIFHMKFPQGTVNIGEFLAIVHALALLQKVYPEMPIYSDSRIAMGWVKKKKSNTKLIPGPNNQELFRVLQRAEIWLAKNPFRNPILKWETAVWGEIPADFGRK